MQRDERLESIETTRGLEGFGHQIEKSSLLVFFGIEIIGTQTNGVERTRSPTPERESSMLDIEKMIILRSVPVFSGLSEQSLADIAGTLEEEEVTAGREIIREGEV